MKVIWDKDTIKNIAKYILKTIKGQNIKIKDVLIPADLHRNTYDNLMAGKAGITFETVTKVLMALNESFDALLLDLFPDRIIGLKNETKKINYFQSIIHYTKNQSISPEEIIDYINQHWEETP